MTLPGLKEIKKDAQKAIDSGMSRHWPDIAIQLCDQVEALTLELIRLRQGDLFAQQRKGGAR
jgi:hypothetical protein